MTLTCAVPAVVRRLAGTVAIKKGGFLYTGAGAVAKEVTVPVGEVQRTMDPGTNPFPTARTSCPGEPALALLGAIETSEIASIVPGSMGGKGTANANGDTTLVTGKPILEVNARSPVRLSML